MKPVQVSSSQFNQSLNLPPVLAGWEGSLVTRLHVHMTGGCDLRTIRLDLSWFEVKSKYYKFLDIHIDIFQPSHEVVLSCWAHKVRLIIISNNL